MPVFALALVSIGPGAIALNLIPYLPHSLANDLCKNNLLMSKMVFPFSHYIFCCLVYPTFSYSYLVIASTPALAVAEGTTNPDPCSVYVAVIAKKLAPIIQKYIICFT